MEEITLKLDEEIAKALDELKLTDKSTREDTAFRLLHHKVQEKRDVVVPGYICKYCGFASPDRERVERCAKRHPNMDDMKCYYKPGQPYPVAITAWQGDFLLVFNIDAKVTTELNSQDDNIVAFRKKLKEWCRK